VCSQGSRNHLPEDSEHYKKGAGIPFRHTKCCSIYLYQNAREQGAVLLPVFYLYEKLVSFSWALSQLSTVDCRHRRFLPIRMDGGIGSPAHKRLYAVPFLRCRISASSSMVINFGVLSFGLSIGSLELMLVSTFSTLIGCSWRERLFYC